MSKVEELLNSAQIKYGDSDVASKRRKSSSDPDEGDYKSFELGVVDVENVLNSTAIENEDFKGGSLLSSTDTSMNSNISNNSANTASDSIYISNKPSDTSRGFENTFKILEQHIRTRWNNGQRQTFLRSITEEETEEPQFPEQRERSTSPDMLELQLEALQRVKTLLKDKPQSEVEPTNVSEEVTSPLNESLYGIKVDGQISQLQTNNADEIVLEEKFKSPEYAYHISKGKDGRKYLRVVRSMLLDKVLCGNRVSQMTRAYDDIEAITRLLEEKEKDLELTVQIGKELLTQNNRLENRITELEADLKNSNEDRSQLVHELHQKTELISILTNDVDSENDNTPQMSKSITLDLLQKKISSLQDENKSLKMEVSQIAKETDEVEEHERRLMEDITSQLNSTNSQFETLSLELERHREENRLQHEQILNLQARLQETEMRLHQVTQENDEQVSLLSITKENQNLLALELAEFKVRYQEVLALLQESQEQLRQQRKKGQPHARSSIMPGVGTSGFVHLPPPDSLQSELMESSLYSENSLDSGISGDRMSMRNSGLFAGSGGFGQTPAYKKVFETVKCAAKNGNYCDTGASLNSSMAMSSSSGPRMSTMPYCNPPAGSYHRPSSVGSFDSSSLGNKTMSCDSLASQSDDGYPSGAPSGVPGAPGAKDLEAALKRLTPAEVLARRAMLSYAPAGTYNYDDASNRDSTALQLAGIRTPESIMSTGSGSHLHRHSSTSSSNHWRLPEKLQIVKPMEGSQTLHHWSRLATPTLSGLLEDRPGVKIRGGRDLGDLGMEIYSLSDVEEDFNDDLSVGKRFQNSECIYTFTNSMVMHPDDGAGLHDISFLSQSQVSSRMASNSTSRQPSCPPTPGLSRRNSCSTFSVNMGLASMLNERGIKAVTPSALNTPAGPNFSPTVTPCNSPEGSPTRPSSPEPMFGLLTSGADLIRRKIIGTPSPILQKENLAHQQKQKILLSRLEKRALRSLKLVEKVESIGLENIISTTHSVGSGIASRSISPMAQLTSFKNFNTMSAGSSSASSVVDDLHFDREQIKGVLNKGLSSSTKKKDKTSDDLFNSEEIYINHIPVMPDELLASPTETIEPSARAMKPPSSTDIRVKQMQRQKSRRNLKNGVQRSDLGTVGGKMRPDLGKVTTSATATSAKKDESPEKPQTSFFSSLFGGRKGGWL